MDIREVVEQLLREDSRDVKQLTQGCGSCRRFVRRLRRKQELAATWDDVPSELLKRFSSRLHQRLFSY